MWVSYTDNQGEQTTARRSAGAGEIKEINMSDLIDRQQAIDDIWTVSPLASLDREWIDRWLRQLPPAQPERIKGRWIAKEKKNLFRCSKCDAVIYSESEYDRNEFHKFCGRCGAEMEVTT